MGLRKSWCAAAALTMACTPVVGLAQTVLFSDNYDSGTSASRYTFFSADRQSYVGAAGGTFAAGSFTGDTNANFAFDYTNFTYRYTDEFEAPATAKIPAAPHGGGLGLRMDVNAANAGSALIQALPKLTEYLGGAAPSGDHKLAFDVFIDYNGPRTGGGGSTEWFLAGINNDGVNPAGARLGGEPFATGTGYAIAIDGERGNSIDYRQYRDNTRLDTVGAPRSGYVAQTDNIGTVTYGSADARNAFYQKLFPLSAGYDTDGAVGKKWNTVEISQLDGIIYTTINGNLISARSNDTNTAGSAMLGYADFNNTSAALDSTTGDDQNFAVFDNVSVTQLTQTRPTWTGADGVWSDSTKWSTAAEPNGGNITADFGSLLPVTGNVTVDGNKIVRSIVFNNNSYTLTGGTITLSAYTQADVDHNDGPETVLLSGINGTLIDNAGNHTIGSTIVINSPLVATVVQAGNTLTLAGDLITNNNDVRKNGAGKLVVKNVVTTGALGVNAGTVRIASNGTNSGVSNVATLTIAGATDAWTGRLDLDNNSMVVDYAATSPLATIQNQLKSGFAGGSWNGTGIASTAAGASTPSQRTAIGYAEAAQLFATFPAIYRGQTLADGTAMVMQYTLAGDGDLSGTVDLTDFTFLAANFNGSGKVWRDGDFDYNGTVDLTDFTFLAANFNKTMSAPSGDLGTAVPEPAAMSLLMLAGAALARRRSRR